MSAHIATIEVPPDHWPVPSPYARAIATLRERCPDYVEEERWRQCIADAEGFIAGWGEQAAALGWTERDLFGPHEPPAKPHPSYQRLRRRDCIGLRLADAGPAGGGAHGRGGRHPDGGDDINADVLRPPRLRCPHLCRATDHARRHHQQQRRMKAMRQIRLYFSSVQPDEPCFSLMGGADFGCAID